MSVKKHDDAPCGGIGSMAFAIHAIHVFICNAMVMGRQGVPASRVGVPVL